MLPPRDFARHHRGKLSGETGIDVHQSGWGLPLPALLRGEVAVPSQRRCPPLRCLQWQHVALFVDKQPRWLYG